MKRKRSTMKRRSMVLAVAVVLSLLFSLGQGLIPGTKAPEAHAHNLQTKMNSMFFDEATRQMLADKIAAGWTPGELKRLGLRPPATQRKVSRKRAVSRESRGAAAASHESNHKEQE